MNDSDVQIQIGAKINAGGAATGAEETISQIDRIAEKTVAATSQTVAADREATAAVQTLTAAQHEAAAVAQLYQTNVATAERALAILGATTGEAMENMTALDAAMDQAQAEAVKAAASTAAYNQELKATAAAAIAAAEAEEKQAAMSEVLAAALVRVGISEADVAAMATKMGISLEVAGRAMIQIKQAALADEVTAARVAIEAMTASTVEAAAEQEVMGEVAMAAGNKGAMAFGRGSPFFHAMVSSVNMSRGGTMALRGFFEAIELASVVLPGFIGPLLLLGATIYEVTEHLDKNKEKLGDSKDGIDKYAAAWSLATAQITGYNTAMESMLASQKDQLATDDRLLTNAKERAALEATDAKQEQERRLQGLRGQYLQDQAGAKTDEERKAMKERYEAAKKDIEDGGVVNTALLDAVETQIQIEITTKKLAESKAQNAADTLEVARAHNAAVEAQNRLDPHGISLDKNGKKLNQIDPNTGKDIDPIAQKQNELEQWEERQAKERNFAVATMSPEVAAKFIAKSDEFLKAKQQEITGLQDDLATLLKDRDAESVLGSKLKDQDEAIKKLQDELEKLKAELPQKQAAVGLAVTNRNQDSRQVQIDAKTEQDKDNTKDERLIRDANLQTQIDDLDRRMKETTDQGLLKTLGDQRAQLEAQQVRNETTDKQADVVDKPAVYSAIGAEGAAKAGVVVAGQDQRDSRVVAQDKEKADKEAAKTLAEEIRQATAQIETSHNPEAIAEMRKFIATAKRVPQDQAALLQELIGLMKEINETQSHINYRTKTDIGDIHSQLRRLGAQ